MARIERLTEEQESLMGKIRDEWLSRAFSGFSFNREDAHEGIEWIYSLCNLPAPKVIFVSSPLGAQFAANLLSNKNTPAQVGAQVRDQVWVQVRDQVGAQVWAQVGDQVWAQVGVQVRDQVGAQVWAQVWAQVGAQVRDQVRVQVRDQVGDQVGDQVWAQVGAQVRDQKLTNYTYAYVGWNYFGWIAWAQFFKEIGIKLTDKLEPFLKYLRSNCFDFIPFNGLAIVCEPPKRVSRDEQFRLSSNEGPCIEWSDGFKLWAVNGVFFEYELWEKVVNSKLSAKEVMALSNMEQRMIALKFAGAEHTLEAMGAKLVDKSTRGNELYLVENFFEEDPKAYFLKYSCPSTGRVYLSGIDPTFAPGKKADECMAWKHRITLPEYNELRFES